nr:MAG TPA: hypothetical protein [Caudoviricetes sp.]DAY34099.1 MAG TPA: hypothetical protein [Caudoviricetes sp.]
MCILHKDKERFSITPRYFYPSFPWLNFSFLYGKSFDYSRIRDGLDIFTII